MTTCSGVLVMAFTVVQTLCTALLVLVVSWILIIFVRSVSQILFPKKPSGRPRFEVGEITLEELSKYDGRDPYRPILIAVKGVIYDVSSQANFYGPGTSFNGHCFQGHWRGPAAGSL